MGCGGSGCHLFLYTKTNRGSKAVTYKFLVKIVEIHKKPKILFDRKLLLKYYEKFNYLNGHNWQNIRYAFE